MAGKGTGKKVSKKATEAAPETEATVETTNGGGTVSAEEVSEMVRKCVEEGICNFGENIGAKIEQTKENISKEVEPLKKAVDMLIGHINRLSETTAKLSEREEAPPVDKHPVEEPAKVEPKAKEPKPEPKPEGKDRFEEVQNQIKMLQAKIRAIQHRNRLESRVKKELEAREAKPTPEPTKETPSDKHVHTSIEEALACPECRNSILKQIRDAWQGGQLEGVIDTSKVEEIQPGEETTTEEPTSEATSGVTTEQEEPAVQEKPEPKTPSEEPAKEEPQEEPPEQRPGQRGRFYELFLKNRNR